jgi:hypothetical protein
MVEVLIVCACQEQALVENLIFSLVFKLVLTIQKLDSNIVRKMIIQKLHSPVFEWSLYFFY